MDNGVPIKLVIIGGDNSGKTKFIQYFMGEDIDINSYTPTLTALFSCKRIKFYQQNIKLEIWDTAGKERFETLTKIFTRL